MRRAIGDNDGSQLCLQPPPVSTSASESGWNVQHSPSVGGGRRGPQRFTFSSRQRSAISGDMKGVPWSVRISAGMPTRLDSRKSSWAMAFGCGLPQGDRLGVPGGVVDDHQDVFVSPAADLGNGPTRSIPMCSKGTSMMGSGISGWGELLGWRHLAGGACLAEPFHLGVHSGHGTGPESVGSCWPAYIYIVSRKSHFLWYLLQIWNINSWDMWLSTN